MIKIHKKIVAFSLLLCLFFHIGWAQTPFVIQNIQFRGLQRISSDTAMSYLPVKSGTTLTSEKAQSVINALFSTHFFESIELSKNGNTLIITVIELPTIGHIRVSGYSDITKDQIEKVL